MMLSLSMFFTMYAFVAAKSSLFYNLLTVLFLSIEIKKNINYSQFLSAEMTSKLVVKLVIISFSAELDY